MAICKVLCEGSGGVAVRKHCARYYLISRRHDSTVRGYFNTLLKASPEKSLKLFVQDVTGPVTGLCYNVSFNYFPNEESRLRLTIVPTYFQNLH